MTFGEKLKMARIDAGLKQSELAKIVGTTNTTISNWEKGVSKPDLDMLSFLCGALNVKASYFLQPQFSDDEISVKELNIVKKYRKLDDYGKDTVNMIIEREYQRCIDYQVTIDGSIHFIEPYSKTKQNTQSIYNHQLNMLNAAHARTDIEVTAADLKHDDDIMDDENF